MGLGCRPMGQLKKMMKKVENENAKASAAKKHSSEKRPSKKED